MNPLYIAELIVSLLGTSFIVAVIWMVYNNISWNINNLKHGGTVTKLFTLEKSWSEFKSVDKLERACKRKLIVLYAVNTICIILMALIVIGYFWITIPRFLPWS